ncbi:hypothetical protein FB45DRAFT_6030 [Roridomyces roridus]|uniref:F-box domain-containing protein n=1 Tax=Roridomyces roridus TaxID=1738132 RepID=A0AAD7G1M5_9AGAR|nr:hypothetical protein FB45DRAFT_6030 [Roridomyces roridus]
MPCNSTCSTHCHLFRPLNLGDPSEGLLLSNTIPSDLQIATISTALDKAKQDITRVQDAIALLSAQRAELNEFIRLQGSVVSRRLPNEMLSEIFVRCVDADATFDPVHNAGWVLARVSRRWRSVALTTPDVWSHFVFRDYDYMRTGVHLPIPSRRFWEMQLERAQLAPLSICFTVATTDELADMFFAVAHQWKEITFVNNWHFSRFVKLGFDYPYLKRIILNDDDFRGPLLPANAPDADLVKALPALTDLALGSCDWKPFPGQLRLPWSQLNT